MIIFICEYKTESCSGILLYKEVEDGAFVCPTMLSTPKKQ